MVDTLVSSLERRRARAPELHRNFTANVTTATRAPGSCIVSGGQIRVRRASLNWQGSGLRSDVVVA